MKNPIKALVERKRLEVLEVQQKHIENMINRLKIIAPNITQEELSLYTEQLHKVSDWRLNNADEHYSKFKLDFGVHVGMYSATAVVLAVLVGIGTFGIGMVALPILFGVAAGLFGGITYQNLKSSLENDKYIVGNIIDEKALTMLTGYVLRKTFHPAVEPVEKQTPKEENKQKHVNDPVNVKSVSSHRRHRKHGLFAEKKSQVSIDANMAKLESVLEQPRPTR